MANDRPLDLTIVHDDGTTIHYAEEKTQGTYQEISSSEGSGAVRVLYCLWTDRVKFREALEGFQELKNADAGIGIKYIHRAFPDGLEMGYYDTPSIWAGPRYWVYCVKTEIIGEVESENYKKYADDGVTLNPGFSETSVKYQYWAKYAIVKATYAALDYDIKQDPYAYTYTGAAWRANEWVRNCRVTYKQGGKYGVDRTQFLKWAKSPTDNVGPHNAVGSGIGATFWDPYADLVVQWLDVPFIPIAAMRTCQGKVNQALFLDGSTDYPAGFKPETLVYLGGEPTRNMTRLNRVSWNLAYYFREVNNPAVAPDTEPYGHNHLRRLIDVAGGAKKREFQRVSYDGTSSLAAGNPFIDVADFDSLFKPV